MPFYFAKSTLYLQPWPPLPKFPGHRICFFKKVRLEKLENIQVNLVIGGI